MTDRHSGYVVVLEEDLRSDDAEATLTALRMTKGVLTVEPIIASLAGKGIIEERVRAAIRAKVVALLRDI